MQLLLAALGARLAPPPTARRIAAAKERLGLAGPLPASLLRFYAVTDGAALPLLHLRIRSVGELERDGESLVLADGDARVLCNLASGEVVDGAVHHDDVFVWLVALLRDCGLSPKSEYPRPSSQYPSPSPSSTSPASTSPSSSSPSTSPSREIPKTKPQIEPVTTMLAAAATSADLLTRVCDCLECRGWKAIRTGAPFEVRVQHGERGSWYSVEPWLGRTSEPGIADRIADRFIRRERSRNASWKVRRDGESIETQDLSEVVSWARQPWESLQVGCGVAHVSLSVFAGRDDHLVSFEWHGGAWQARARLSPTQVRAALEHLLLRRDKWPGLEWTQMRQPPS